jgi:hydroxymethylbilane synthase
LKSTYTIACRGSWLSLAQAEIFKKKVAAIYPDVIINITLIDTAGDKEQNAPLHLVEGTNFFTKEIQDYLHSNQADFAIHSMKDVSSEGFFNAGHYAIIDRDLLHDVAIFNENIIDKINQGEKIIIGTSSPRRCNMATDFLKKALPQLNDAAIVIEARAIRGNVDTRMQKLHSGSYDGIILAAAGLNRLLQYQPAKKKIAALLQNKKLMLLPLFECPPAAGQGAIVAETTNDNTSAIEILNTINNKQLTSAIKAERLYAKQYGYGCSQQFGVFHLDTPAVSFTYASGKDGGTKDFTEWGFHTSLNLHDKQLFSSTDYMKDFFTCNFLDNAEIDDVAEVFFIGSHKAIHSNKLKQKIQQKRVWAAGTRTWYQLAKKGIWVEGCADGMGFDFLKPIFKSPLIKIALDDIQIITNNLSKTHWIADGIKAIGTYGLTDNLPDAVKTNIACADIIFWTSFQQYELCKPFIKNTAQHVCPAGKTATLLKAKGVHPIIFPVIKAFIDWRAKNSKV